MCSIEQIQLKQLSISQLTLIVQLVCWGPLTNRLSARKETESIDGKNKRSKGKAIRGNVFDRTNSTQTIIAQSTHLDHSTCLPMNLINCLPCLLQGIKRNVSDGNTGQSNERSIQTAINSEKSYLLFYFHNQPVLCQRFLPAKLLRAKWFWSRKNALFIGLHWRQCTLFGTGFSYRFQKLILRRVFSLLSESCTAHVQRHRSRAINECKPQDRNEPPLQSGAAHVQRRKRATFDPSGSLKVNEGSGICHQVLGRVALCLDKIDSRKRNRSMSRFSETQQKTASSMSRFLGNGTKPSSMSRKISSIF